MGEKKPSHYETVWHEMSDEQRHAMCVTQEIISDTKSYLTQIIITHQQQWTKWNFDGRMTLHCYVVRYAQDTVKHGLSAGIIED